MEITLYRTIGVQTCTTLDLEPGDYLYCDTVEELQRDIEDDIAESEDIDIDMGAMETSETESILKIPNEFIKEWNRLKYNESKLSIDNIMKVN